MPTGKIKMHYPSTEAKILGKVRLYANDNASLYAMSTGECIAVALVLDRPDLLELVWGTMAESVHKLGPEWTQAALNVQRDGRARREKWTLPKDPLGKGPGERAARKFYKNYRATRAR